MNSSTRLSAEAPATALSSSDTGVFGYALAGAIGVSVLACEKLKVCSTPASGMDRGYFAALCRGVPELEETNGYE